MLVAWLITWLFVSTRPSPEMTIPVPSADSLLYWSVELTSTTAGSTFAAIAAAFSGPLPVLPWPPLFPVPLPLPVPGRPLPAPEPPPAGLPPKPLPAPLPPCCGMVPGPDAAEAGLEWFSSMAANAPTPAASAATVA